MDKGVNRPILVPDTFWDPGQMMVLPIFLRRHIIQGFMRAFTVIFWRPSFRDFPHFIQRSAPAYPAGETPVLLHVSLPLQACSKTTATGQGIRHKIDRPALVQRFQKGSDIEPLIVLKEWVISRKELKSAARSVALSFYRGVRTGPKCWMVLLKSDTWN